MYHYFSNLDLQKPRNAEVWNSGEMRHLQKISVIFKDKSSIFADNSSIFADNFLIWSKLYEKMKSSWNSTIQHSGVSACLLLLRQEPNSSRQSFVPRQAIYKFTFPLLSFLCLFRSNYLFWSFLSIKRNML